MTRLHTKWRISLLARPMQIWVNLRSSLWFVPGLIVLASIGLAIALISAEALISDEVLQRWPRIFGAGAEGSRSLLAAVATSMITVAGVAFSVTVVAITLAANLYSSRVLRTFMRDRANQAVLGVFVGIFAYCLIVVRTISSQDDISFVPSVAVFGGLVLALVGVGFLIFFIHHIALSVQVSQILAVICKDTLNSIDSLFPPGKTSGAPEDVDGASLPGVWHTVPAHRSGYVQRLDVDALVQLAKGQQWVIRMEKGVGAFLIEDLPLLSVQGPAAPDDDMAADLHGAISVGRQRTVEQDPGFGIRQIVDIALKALSPGVNDTTTAVMCVDYLTVILLRLGRRTIRCVYRDEQGAARLLTCGPTFESLLINAIEQIRQNAAGNVTIIAALVQCLETLAQQASSAEQCMALRTQLEAIYEAVMRTIEAPLDRERLADRCSRLMQRLAEIRGRESCEETSAA